MERHGVGTVGDRTRRLRPEPRASAPKRFPDLAKFQDVHASGKLSSLADVVARILAYLDRNDFGVTNLDDIRHDG